MSELSWEAAIIKVLNESKEPLHYQVITEQILSRGIKGTKGATPNSTVNSEITKSIKNKGIDSPFQRVGRGIYTLKANTTALSTLGDEEVNNEVSSTVIRAFGMYWQRNLVVWRRRNSKLYGRQHVGTKGVDFGKQTGVYILYDHHSVIYVGRSVTDLSARLYEHTLDRLSGRWDRFSWFGLYDVTDDGKLREHKQDLSFSSIVTALESILIETLEPPQNRRRGDYFDAVEYIQDVDPEFREQELQSTLRKIEQKLRQPQ